MAFIIFSSYVCICDARDNRSIIDEKKNERSEAKWLSKKAMPMTVKKALHFSMIFVFGNSIVHGRGALIITICESGR